jgi:hypothetical protein
LEKRQYATNWVRFIENFLGLRLADDQVKTWVVSLERYENWRLDELINFRLNEEGRGRTLADVCRFLDALMPHPERESVREDTGYKQITEEPESKISERTQLARDVNAHIQRMISFIGDGKLTEESLSEKRRVEYAGLQELHEKYPHAGFNRVMKESRFNKIPA